MRTRIAIFVAIAQTILLLGHWIVYETLTTFWQVSHPTFARAAFALLSVSFVTATMLAWRSSHVLVRLFYTAAAVWLGVGSYLLFASILCWLAYGATELLGLPVARGDLALVLFGLAILVSVYGIINAGWIRVNRIFVKLAKRPESWRGRVAALVSDSHVGHVRGYRFARRIVAMLNRLGPDIVFIAGDWYDGTKADLHRLAEPWRTLTAPFGAYYAAGNHEEFTDHTKYLDAMTESGIRVLNNERVTVDGLQVVGVHHGDSTDAGRFRQILQQATLDRDKASVLLTHAPDCLQVAEEEGVSLQLSGHTHGGQFFPWTWIASRVYGPFVHGLNQLRNLIVYTSYGTGTWGPPMRVGTSPEIVLIQFE